MLAETIASTHCAYPDLDGIPAIWEVTRLRIYSVQAVLRSVTC